MELRNIGDEKDRLFEALAQVGKAFSNPKRFQLLGLLAQGERSVDALAATASMGVTTVSAHLQNLKAVGLVTTRRAGTHVYYRLAGDDVTSAFVAVRDVAIARSPAVTQALRTMFASEDDTAIEEVGRDDLMKRGLRNVAVVDVRPRAEFATGHLPGAVSIPIGELESELERIDPDVEVVAYCRGAHCVMADDAVRLAARCGRTIRRLEGGFVEWSSEHRPVEVMA